MKRIIVAGLGKSGLAAAEYLLKKGESVLGFDDAVSARENAKHLAPLGLQIGTDPTSIDWDSIAFLLVSPGISPEHPLYRAAVEKHIAVIGEVEFAFRTLCQRAVAITGTNGKTTVTMLIEHVLKSAGFKARALGNIGEPLCAYALESNPEEVLIVELSSFQIETLSAKVFEAAVLLNIAPDHLDRYSDMQAYACAKCALQKCMKENGVFFVHKSVESAYGHLLEGNYIVYNELLVSDRLDRIAQHDKDNACAAWAICREFGISPEQFLSSLETFRKPSHRIEFVCEIDGICYYDDSKGTNVDAAVHAVNAMSGPVILIAGGVDKGSSYMPWTQLKKKIKSIIVLGEAASKIRQELEPYFDIQCASTMDGAVEIAAGKAIKGDTVLLSPGCSSYDMFENYAHRGKEFQRCVQQRRAS